MKIGFISLGCSKNLVDTEMMIGLTKKQGLEIVNDECKNYDEDIDHVHHKNIGG